MATYEDTPLTNFPDAEDNWARMSDITATLLPVALQYNSLWENGQIDEANALLDANPNLKQTIFNADKWNKLRDAVIAIERYYLNDVTDFINHVAQQAIGIDDNPSEEDKNTTTYSANKIDTMIENIDTTLTTTLNTTITNMEKIITVTFPVSGWVGESAPFTQTITVEGVTEDDAPMLLKYRGEAEFDPVTAKAYNKAFGCLADGEGIIGNGTITWKTIKKPAIDITIALKGFVDAPDSGDEPDDSVVPENLEMASFSNMTFADTLPNSGEYAGLIQGDLEVTNSENSNAKFLGKINNENNENSENNESEEGTT